MRVFLSSTFEDLGPERSAVYEALRDEHEVVRMEDFGSRDETSLETCLRELEECDTQIVLLGHRYGTPVRTTGMSYTQTEYERARQLPISVLAYVRDGIEEAFEGSDDPIRLKDFYDVLNDAHTVRRPHFRTAGEVADRVQADVDALRQRGPRPRFGRGGRAVHDGRAYSVGSVRHSRLQLHPFKLVLVDTAVLRAETYPRERVGRISGKLRELQAEASALGANVLTFNEIPGWEVGLGTVLEQRVREVGTHASAVVCIVHGKPDLQAVEHFSDAVGTVVAWYPARLEAELIERDGVIYRGYSDADLSDCTLALRALDVVRDLVDRHLVASLSS